MIKNKLIVTGCLLFLTLPLSAQELEPRSLTNVPVGLNFVLFGYGYGNGNTLLDPALPLEDLKSDVHTFFAAYVRSIDFFGMPAKVDVVIPWAAGNWDGIYEGEQRDVKRDGFGDPRIRLAFNFFGASSYTGPFDASKTGKTVANSYVYEYQSPAYGIYAQNDSGNGPGQGG